MVPLPKNNIIIPIANDNVLNLVILFIACSFETDILFSIISFR